MHERRPVKRRSDPLRTLGFYTTLFCALLSVCILTLFMRELIAETGHPLFSAISLGEAFIASLVMVCFSLQRSIVRQLTCVFVSIFYTLRVFVLYLAPEHMEYSTYQYGSHVYTHANVELATRYLLFFCAALLLASLLHAMLYPSLTSRPRNATNVIEVSDRINFFGIRVDFGSFLRWALRFTVLAALFRVYAFVSDWGIRVGAVYRPDQYLLRIFQSLSFPFYLLAVFAFAFGTDRLTRRLSRIVIGLIVVDGILATSRGWAFGLMAKYLICVLVLNIAITRRAKLAACGVIVGGLMLLYPAMSMLRPMRLSEEFNLSNYLEALRRHDAIDGINITSYGGLVLTSVDRFAGFDWLVLWMNVDSGDIPPNISLWGEFVDFINKFVPGEIITIPGSMQLDKLQAVLGGTRRANTIEELGGQGEVAGGVATLAIFFGPGIGLVAAGVWLFAFLCVERSRLHALHKAYLYQVYVQDFIVGGGYLIMPSSFLWYLVVSVLIAGTIHFLPSRRIGYSRAPGPVLVPRTSAGRLG